MNAVYSEDNTSRFREYCRKRRRVSRKIATPLLMRHPTRTALGAVGHTRTTIIKTTGRVVGKLASPRGARRHPRGITVAGQEMRPRWLYATAMSALAAVRRPRLLCRLRRRGGSVLSPAAPGGGYQDEGRGAIGTSRANLAGSRARPGGVAGQTWPGPPLPQWGVQPTHLNISSGRHLSRTMMPKSLT